MNTIAEDAVRSIEYAEQQLHSVTKDAEVIKQLPTWIAELTGYAAVIRDYSIEKKVSSISIVAYPDIEVENCGTAEQIVKLLKMKGVVGLKLHMTYYQSWLYQDGVAVINGIKCLFTVNSAKPSEECTITEYTETVTKYKAICPQGKEV